MKRMSRPAATLASHSSSEKLSTPSEPAHAVGKPSRATQRATFQPAPPGRDSHCEAPVRTRSVRMSPAETKTGSSLFVVAFAFALLILPAPFERLQWLGPLPRRRAARAR